MANRKIDYDRGVLIKTHPSMGMDIYMYVDTPGVYLNAFGTEVPMELATASGYDTERFGKEKIKRERMKLAMASIEAELELADKQEKQEVVYSKGDFKVVDIGLGRHFVQDPDGNRLTTQAIPLEQAKVLVDQLVPKVEKEKVNGSGTGEANDAGSSKQVG
jgi:hypothetical protein